MTGREELVGHRPFGTVARAVGVVEASSSQGGEHTQSPTESTGFDSLH